MFLIRKVVKATKKPENTMMLSIMIMALRPMIRKVSTGASDVRVYPTRLRVGVERLRRFCPTVD